MSHFRTSAHSRPAHYMLRRNTHLSYGYSKSEGFPAIREGATDEGSGGAVTYLRQQLRASDWYHARQAARDTSFEAAVGVDASGPFTGALSDAVKSFQRYSGLTADGIVGPSTWKALGYAGKVTTGSSTRGAGAGGGKAPVGADVPTPPEESIMDKVWFWPVAILVPTAAVIGGILLWPSKKKAPAAVVAA